MTMTPSANTTNGLLKIIFLLHLILSSWGMQSAYTVPTSYFYTNIIFMIVLLWAIANSQSTEAIGMVLVINTTIFIIDIITLSTYWPRGERHRLYLGFAIANTVIRPVTSLLIYKMFRDCDTEHRGLRGLFGDVFNGPVTLLNNIQGNREYRGTAGNGSVTYDNTTPPPPGTRRGGYEQIPPTDVPKI